MCLGGAQSLSKCQFPIIEIVSNENGIWHFEQSQKSGRSVGLAVYNIGLHQAHDDTYKNAPNENRKLYGSKSHQYRELDDKPHLRHHTYPLFTRRHTGI